jgi:hypothetical protein
MFAICSENQIKPIQDSVRDKKSYERKRDGILSAST